MLEQEREPAVCYECDTDFVVHTPYEDDRAVSFCPFCGSEVETEGSFDDLEDLDEDGDGF